MTESELVLFSLSNVEGNYTNLDKENNLSQLTTKLLTAFLHKRTGTKIKRWIRQCPWTLLTKIHQSGLGQKLSLLLKKSKDYQKKNVRRLSDYCGSIHCWMKKAYTDKGIGVWMPLCALMLCCPVVTVSIYIQKSYLLFIF